MTEKRECVPTRIMVVDDHEAARRGIRSILAADSTLDVVCEAADAEEALKSAPVLRPDIILLDITLPGRNGIEAAAVLHRVCPESRIVFVSQHDSTQVAKDALSVGGIGYVVKSDAGLDLLAAIEAAREGRTFVSGKLAARGWKVSSAAK